MRLRLVALALLVIGATAAGCGDDSTRASERNSTTAATPAGHIWARSVADNRVHELDADGTDLGVVEALHGIAGWSFATASPSRRTVAFTDSEPRLVVLDRRTGVLRTAPNLSCFDFRTEQELLASSTAPARPDEWGVLRIDDLPVLGAAEAAPPTWVPYRGPDLDRPCPFRLDGRSSLLQVGSPANADDEVHQQLLRFGPDRMMHQLLDLRDCNAGVFRISPDGSTLASDHNCGGDRNGLYLYDVDTMERRRIGDGLVASPSWSPDGSELVFVRADSSEYTPESMRLFVVDADGTHEHQLSEQPYLFPLWLD